MSKRRVLVVENDPAWSRTLTTALRLDDYEVIEARTLAVALTRLRQLKPDVVTLDMNLDQDREEGWQILQEIDVMLDGPEVIVVTVVEFDVAEMKTLLRGYDVADIIPKSRYDDQVLRRAVKAAIAARSQAEAIPLTDREAEVLRLVVSGLTNKEIAGKLSISLNTVKTHLKTIFEKLAVTNRMEAGNRARELRIL